MLWLIDGYNVMHVAGAIDSKMTRERFRKARRRFLDYLASTLGDLAAETTIVLDANKPPADFPVESNYRGITVVFALADASADARIERILAKHSTPKTLTVVSNDREVRQSATRRKARALKADEFLDRLPTLAYQRRPAMNVPDPEAVRAAPALDDAERAYWEEVFGATDEEPAPREPAPSGRSVTRGAPPAPDRRRVEKPRHIAVDDIPDLRRAMITDADIAAIRREIDREG
jgi:predicted RNA-binding protein with PIN domain